MLHSFRSLLRPPTDPSKDQIENQQIQLAWYLFWLVAGSCLIFSVFFIYKQVWPLIVLAGAIGSAAVVALFLAKSGRTHTGVFAVLGTVYVSVMLMVTFTGGVHDILFQIIYPNLFVFGLLMQRRWLIAFSSLTFVWVLVLLILEGYGVYTPEMHFYDLPTEGSVILATIFMTSTIVLIMGRKINSLNHDLLQSQQEADNANQMKSRYLANMSHELRTPLNAIIGYSENALEEYEEAEQIPWANEEIAEDISRIQQSGRHLLTLVNSILDLSKIEANKMELSIDTFPLQPLVSEAIQVSQPIAKRHGNTISLHVQPGRYELESDKQKVLQILLNLISNSAKYTKNGQIEICVSEVTSQIISVRVKDTGIGIPPEQLPHIFDSFHQVENSLSSSFKGSGLGLTITKKLTQLLGGDLIAESRMGQGSTFTLLLPCCLQEPETATSL